MLMINLLAWPRIFVEFVGMAYACVLSAFFLSLN
jgi:hypothetical protein